jgi:hypothetical protein
LGGGVGWVGEGEGARVIEGDGAEELVAIVMMRCLVRCRKRAEGMATGVDGWTSEVDGLLSKLLLLILSGNEFARCLFRQRSASLRFGMRNN